LKLANRNHRSIDRQGSYPLEKDPKKVYKMKEIEEHGDMAMTWKRKGKPNVHKRYKKLDFSQ